MPVVRINARRVCGISDQQILLERIYDVEANPAWRLVGYFVAAAQGCQIKALDADSFIGKITDTQSDEPVIVLTRPAKACSDFGVTIVLVGVKVPQIVKIFIRVTDIYLDMQAAVANRPLVTYQP